MSRALWASVQILEWERVMELLLFWALVFRGHNCHVYTCEQLRCSWLCLPWEFELQKLVGLASSWPAPPREWQPCQKNCCAHLACLKSAGSCGVTALQCGQPHRARAHFRQEYSCHISWSVISLVLLTCPALHSTTSVSAQPSANI